MQDIFYSHVLNELSQIITIILEDYDLTIEQDGVKCQKSQTMTGESSMKFKVTG